MFSYSDLKKALPYQLSKRFDSIGSYVKAIIDEKETNVPKRNRLKREEVNLIQFIVFFYCLDQLFQEGTRAASIAVDEFKKFDIPGFDIGKSAFEGRNENVMLGHELSQRLRGCIPMELLEFIQKPQSLKSLIIQLMQKVKHG